MIVPKKFPSVYNAGNSRLKTSKNKHLIGLILNYPKNKLSQSEKIFLDHRDTKETIIDFVCALKRKNTNFSDVYSNSLEATQLPPNFVINKNAKRRQRNLDPFQNLKR